MLEAEQDVIVRSLNVALLRLLVRKQELLKVVLRFHRFNQVGRTLQHLEQKQGYLAFDYQLEAVTQCFLYASVLFEPKKQ